MCVGRGDLRSSHAVCLSSGWGPPLLPCMQGHPFLPFQGLALAALHARGVPGFLSRPTSAAVHARNVPAFRSGPAWGVLCVLHAGCGACCWCKEACKEARRAHLAGRCDWQCGLAGVILWCGLMGVTGWSM